MTVTSVPQMTHPGLAFHEKYGVPSGLTVMSTASCASGGSCGMFGSARSAVGMLANAVALQLCQGMVSVSASRKYPGLASGGSTLVNGVSARGLFCGTAG